MMNHKNRRLVILSLSICFLLGGCVWLRLLDVKNQMAKFDEYFTIDSTDRFVLNFKKPVLYSKDILYLMELNPSQVETFGEREIFTFRFQKNGGDPDSTAEDLLFWMNFNDEKKLESFMISPVILQIIPAEFLELSLRSLGNAKIDRKNRQAKADASKVAKKGLEAPHYQKLVDVLGAPAEETVLPEGINLVYRYHLVSDSAGKEAEENKKAVVNLLFNSETRTLSRMAGNFAGLKVSIQYSDLIKDDKVSTPNTPTTP